MNLLAEFILTTDADAGPGRPICVEHESCGQSVALEYPYGLLSAIKAAEKHKCPDYTLLPHPQRYYVDYYWETGKQMV